MDLELAQHVHPAGVLEEERPIHVRSDEVQLHGSILAFAPALVIGDDLAITVVHIGDRVVVDRGVTVAEYEEGVRAAHEGLGVDVTGSLHTSLLGGGEGELQASVEIRIAPDGPVDPLALGGADLDAVQLLEDLLHVARGGLDHPLRALEVLRGRAEPDHAELLVRLEPLEGDPEVLAGHIEAGLDDVPGDVCLGRDVALLALLADPRAGLRGPLGLPLRGDGSGHGVGEVEQVADPLAGHLDPEEPGPHVLVFRFARLGRGLVALLPPVLGFLGALREQGPPRRRLQHHGVRVQLRGEVPREDQLGRSRHVLVLEGGDERERQPPPRGLRLGLLVAHDGERRGVGSHQGDLVLLLLRWALDELGNQVVEGFARGRREGLDGGPA